MTLNSTSLIPVLAVLIMLFLLRRWIYGLSEINAADVPAFLRYIFIEDISDLLHPDADEMHRQNESHKEFKIIQWKRARSRRSSICSQSVCGNKSTYTHSNETIATT